LKSAVSISADKFTKSAEEAISKAGGKAITLIKTNERIYTNT
jgi:large subunit ribosomal protein L15